MKIKGRRDRGAVAPAPWYDDRRSLVALAHWLLERSELSRSTAEALDLFEKPWHWDREWFQFQRWVRGERCQGAGDYECSFLPHECRVHDDEEAYGSGG